MGASSKFVLSVAYTNDTSADATGSTIDALAPLTYAASYRDGTGPGQIRRVYRDHRTLASGSHTYILSDLPGGQGMGRVLLILIWVMNPIGAAVSLAVGPGTTNGWTNGLGAGPLVYGPQSIHADAWPDVTGPAVVAGINDQVTVAATGTVEYLFVVQGVP
jgi:hypothetical protein